MENSQNKKLVLFDFDGVLINTLEHCYQIHTVLNRDFTWEKFQEFSDGNVNDGFDKAIKDDDFLVTDDYYDKYNKELITLSVQDIIHNSIILLAKEYRLVIISSSPDKMISSFLSKENLQIMFSDVLGVDTHRSKIVKIRSILEKYGKSSTDAVFITDTLGDIKEANECKVPSIGVTWGLHDRANLEKGNPALIIDDPQDLVGAVHKILNDGL